MPAKFEPQKTRSGSGFQKNKVKKVGMNGYISNAYVEDLNKVWAYCTQNGIN